MNELDLREKIEKFRISLHNRYSALNEENDLSVQVISDNLTSIVQACALAVGANLVMQDTGKLSHETKDQIKKR